MEYSLEYFSAAVESAVKSLSFPTTAPRLFEPVRYTLESGGKRLRPVLLLAVFSALGRRDIAEAMNQALGIEIFHNFTLLHDDVMDKADLRRGRPTVHRRWNENAAILSGDAMLTYASMLMNRCPAELLAAVSECFNETAMGVYEGQQLDMEFERRMNVTVDEYLEMIKLKTSVLVAGACSIGAIMAGATPDVRARLYDYGLALGIAFQLRDDWLDTFGDPAIFGKEIGGDIVNRKKTWLLITALAESDGELASVLAENLSDHELVAQVRAVYDRLNLNERCSELAKSYSRKAIEALDGIEMDADAYRFFVELAKNASTRAH